jgi:hypothetical protein
MHAGKPQAICLLEGHAYFPRNYVSHCFSCASAQINCPTLISASGVVEVMPPLAMGFFMHRRPTCQKNPEKPQIFNKIHANLAMQTPTKILGRVVSLQIASF